jgi:hypothetical protein
MPRDTFRTISSLAISGLLAACGGADAPEASLDQAPAVTPAAEAGETRSPPPAAGAGTAQVSLTGEGVSISGQYPARLCGGPYMMGEGVSYQTQADEWQITVASESREAGAVSLNTPDGSVNVVVTANGPGLQFVRGPSNGGSLEIAEDYRQATADLELRSIAGGQTAQLEVTFTCNSPA